jgi:transcriptional regulator with XRE-family HTH domain
MSTTFDGEDSEIVTPLVTTRNSDGDRLRAMAERRKYNKTYIREWREHRGLSLRRLADRIELSDEDGDALSYVSLNRIELGKQPYSQPILEALAHALDVTVVDLLSVDPTKEGQVVDLMSLLKDRDPDLVRRVIEALPKRA